MPFKNSNVAVGIPKNNNFQVGVSDVDRSTPGQFQKGVLVPYPSNPEYSWVYYECNVTAILDNGIVVHNRLPQVDNAPDTLASCDYAATNLGAIATGGVNLTSKDQYTDIVHRMGHSRYYFRLYGKALRIGLQVPIPSLKTIGGVPAIPYDEIPQVAFNRIAPGGNYGGLVLWHAAWSLWYTTAVPPHSNVIPTNDPSAQTDGTNNNPKGGMQAPFAAPDDNAVPSGPTATTLKPQIGLPPLTGKPPNINARQP